jgi:uncharacterized protein
MARGSCAAMSWLEVLILLSFRSHHGHIRALSAMPRPVEDHPLAPWSAAGSRLHGHYWTLGAFAARSIRPRAPTVAHAWQLSIPDARLGSVILRGHLTRAQRGGALLIVVHGLGGSADSAYTYAITHSAADYGISTLRLHLRGADRRGEDFFHAGLGSDLGHVLASPELADFEQVALLGYSLGGHVSLSYGAGIVDPRLRAICAVCPPLGLGESARAFDQPGVALYRWHVLRGLKEMYAAFRKRPGTEDLPSIEAAQRITWIQEWDERIVAPRHGFASGQDYYARASVGPKLGALACPALVLSAARDPMVPRETSAPYVSSLPSHVQYRELNRGGHLAFPRSLDLGHGVALGLEAQATAWLAQHLFAGTSDDRDPK